MQATSEIRIFIKVECSSGDKYQNYRNKIKIKKMGRLWGKDQLIYSEFKLMGFLKHRIYSHLVHIF